MARLARRPGWLRPRQAQHPACTTGKPLPAVTLQVVLVVPTRRAFATRVGIKPTAALLIDNSRLFDKLGLSSFDEEEIRAAWEDANVNGQPGLQRDDVHKLLTTVLAGQKTTAEDIARETEKFFELFDDDRDATIGWDEFREHVRDLGRQVDRRVYPLGFSMFCTGSITSLITPVMPELAHTIGISTSGFGLVIGSFFLSKLVFNLPAARYIERWGRKPFLSWPMGVLGLGSCGIAFASSLEELIFYRIISGIGVAGFSGGAVMAATDISTALNRSVTLAPLMMGWAGGAMVGPAVGGSLVDVLGVQSTFLCVGGLYAALGVFNHLTIAETQRAPTVSAKLRRRRAAAAKAAAAADEPGTVVGEQAQAAPDRNRGPGTVTDELREWAGLIRTNSELRWVCGFNAVYWVAMSGAQMTLLPLMLADSTTYGFSAKDLGLCFAGMAGVTTLCIMPAARVADTYGKVPSMVAAGAIVGTSALVVPHFGHLPVAAVLPALDPGHGATMLVPGLAFWALGSTVNGTSPTTHASDVVTAEHRSIATALVRSCGDLGMLFGASAGGILASSVGVPVAIQANGVLLLATSALYGARRLGNATRAPPGALAK